jgi:N-acyl-D-amino-acid deacylase
MEVAALFEVIIAHGTVVDGTGAPGFRSDVGIAGEKIDAIGDLADAETLRLIDATGMVVSPGFVDPHTHSEGDLLVNPQHANGLRQGITTEILGLGGMSFAPLSAPNYRTYRRWLAGILGDPPEDADMSSVAVFRANYHRKVAINTAYLVPNGAIRLETAGFRSGPLTEKQLDDARRLIREGLEQGAVGFSNTTVNYPGHWSDTAELIELARAVSEGGGVYVDASEPFGARRAYGAADGVPEWLEIARQSGVRMHFAHYRTASQTAGRVDEIMQDRDDARAEGVDLTLDIYPYPTGSTVPVTFLPAHIQEGGPDEILKRLNDPGRRRDAVEHLESNRLAALESMVLSYVAGSPELEGMSLPDVAQQRGISLGDALCSLLVENGLKVGYWGSPPDSVALWRQVNRDSMELLARPDYMVCSDITPAGGMPHPRSYGAYPRFLGRLRRAIGGLSLEQMVERMTDRPARRFGISKRGRIEKGCYADLVVFDADRVIDTATYDDPRQFPVGIPYVLVNGQVAVDRERCTGVMAGQAVP